MLNRFRRSLTTTLLSCLILAFLIIPAFAAPVQIRILHVNDFHGYAEPYEPFGSTEPWGGAAYLAAKIKELRQDEKIPTLLLSAGDMIQGNLWTNLNRGKATIELMNVMKFDAMALGNHEFDFGQDVLKQRMAEAKFPMLAANVEGLSGLKPYVIKTVGGIRIGIIGVVTVETPTTTHPDNVKGLTFVSPEAACSRYLDEVKKLADVVVILSHIGHEEDLRLASRIQGVHAIIGGHSHTRVDRPPLVGKTIVLQAWEHGKALGVLDITVDNGQVVEAKGRLIDIKPSGQTPDREVAALVARYSAEANTSMSIVLGKACSDLDGQSVRLRETNLGNLIADALRDATGADIALFNGGSIRASLKAGGITLKDMESVLPFDNYAVMLSLTGGQIRLALEHGLSGLEEKKGGFLQVSGLRMIYDKGAPVGSRVKSVAVAGTPLDEKKIYRVAVNDFMAAGGDGFVILKSAAKTWDFDKGLVIRDVVADYLHAKGNVCPGVEGRILYLLNNAARQETARLISENTGMLNRCASF